MYRPLVLLAVALALAAPASALAQTPAPQAQTERDRERERERIERERERIQEERERQMEKAQEARDRAQEARERAQERRDQQREQYRDRQRRERDSAGALDTVVAFDAHGSVTVTCPGGAVVVTASDRGEVRVRARTENGGIRFASSGGRAVLEPAAGRGCSDGRFEVVVPAGSRVTTNTWSGSISVRGVGGDIDAHAQSGDIDIRDAGGRLDVESLSGDVMVANVRGDATIHTISGDVSITGAHSPVEVETVSGDLQLRDMSARQVRTHTTSGDVTFAGIIVDAGRYEFSTQSGEVRLQLPANVGAQLSVSTFNGGIESDFPITLKAGEHGLGSSSTKRLDFTLGQGTARIIAETFSGDITLSSNTRRP